MVALRLFAAAREAAGVARAEVAGATVGDVLDAARAEYGGRFAAVLERSKVWVNGEPATPETPVGTHDVVAVLPPVSGGAGDGATALAPPVDAGGPEFASLFDPAGDAAPRVHGRPPPVLRRSPARPVPPPAVGAGPAVPGGGVAAPPRPAAGRPGPPTATGEHGADLGASAPPTSRHGTATPPSASGPALEATPPGARTPAAPRSGSTARAGTRRSADAADGTGLNVAAPARPSPTAAPTAAT
ncbi:MAG: MoaD/ThiS family protein, partial [Acidimicrobiales bacterium]